MAYIMCMQSSRKENGPRLFQASGDKMKLGCFTETDEDLTKWREMENAHKRERDIERG